MPNAPLFPNTIKGKIRVSPVGTAEEKLVRDRSGHYLGTCFWDVLAAGKGTTLNFLFILLIEIFLCANTSTQSSVRNCSEHPEAAGWTEGTLKQDSLHIDTAVRTCFQLGLGTSHYAL